MTDPRPFNLLREGRLQYRESQLDPNGELDPAERRRLAIEADRQFYLDIGRRSGIARRAKAARLAALQAAAIRRAMDPDDQSLAS